MTPSGIEPVTFRFVAQHVNHYATAVPPYVRRKPKMLVITSLSQLPSHEPKVFCYTTFDNAAPSRARNRLSLFASLFFSVTEGMLGFHSCCLCLPYLLVSTFTSPVAPDSTQEPEKRPA